MKLWHMKPWIYVCVCVCVCVYIYIYIYIYIYSQHKKPPFFSQNPEVPMFWGVIHDCHTGPYFRSPDHVTSRMNHVTSEMRKLLNAHGHSAYQTWKKLMHSPKWYDFTLQLSGAKTQILSIHSTLFRITQTWVRF